LSFTSVEVESHFLISIIADLNYYSSSKFIGDKRGNAFAFPK